MTSPNGHVAVVAGCPFLGVETWLASGETSELDPKPTFRAEGGHSRDIRRRRERALVSLSDLPSYRRDWARVLGGKGPVWL